MACIAQDQLQAISVLKDAYNKHLLEVNADYLLVNNIYEGQVMAGTLSAMMKEATSMTDIPLVKIALDAPKDMTKQERLDYFSKNVSKKQRDQLEAFRKNCLPCFNSRMITDIWDFFNDGNFFGQNLIGKYFVDPFLNNALKQLETIARLKKYLTGHWLLDDICRGLRSMPEIMCVPDLLAMLAAFTFALKDLKKLPGGIKFDINDVISYLLMPLVNGLLALLKQLLELLLRPLDCIIASIKLQLKKVRNSQYVIKQYKDKTSGKLVSIPVKAVGHAYNMTQGIGESLLDFIEPIRDSIYNKLNEIIKWVEAIAKDKLKKDKDTIEKIFKIKGLTTWIRIINSAIQLAKIANKVYKRGELNIEKFCRDLLSKDAPLAKVYQKQVIDKRFGESNSTLYEHSRDFIEETQAGYWNLGKEKKSSQDVVVPAKKNDTVLDLEPSTMDLVVVEDPTIGEDFFAGTEIDNVIENLPFNLETLTYDDSNGPDSDRLDYGFINQYRELKNELTQLNSLAEPDNSQNKAIQKTLNKVNSNKPKTKGYIVSAIEVDSCFREDSFSNAQLQEWINMANNG